jgi:hypothetical protein
LWHELQALVRAVLHELEPEERLLWEETAAGRSLAALAEQLGVAYHTLKRRW